MTCPCGSLLALEECCARFHEGLEPETPERLMRSRYSAFVLGDLDYLWKTLHVDHDDRARDENEWRDAVTRSLPSLRYEALEVVETTPPDRDGVATVTFRVSLFHVTTKRVGKRKKETREDRSFTERSSFVHDGVGWRYLVGDIG